jgi:hypothetical protein
MESYLDQAKFGIVEFYIDLAYLVPHFRLRS